jgi:two-component system, OmpR family, response regulator
LRILLIDDDTELSAMVAEYLAVEGFETAVVNNGEDGVAAALSGDYGAVILDVMMPRMSGIEVLRQVRRSSQVPVIMLTAKGDDIDRVIGLEMGADDYVPKPYYPRELLARLKAILRRAPASAPPKPQDQLVAGRLSLWPQRRLAEAAGKALELTASEFNLLEILMRAADQVASKEELSLQALGRHHEPYDRSVDVHMSNLRQKLSQIPGAQVEIETVRGIGYRLKRAP